MNAKQALDNAKQTMAAVLKAAAASADLEQYLATALWADLPEDADKNLTSSDIAPESRATAEKELSEFLEKAMPLLEKYDTEEPKEGDLAHDFWLTRNGHGAGFWDGDWGDELGGELTKLAESFGGVDLYVGDDGKVYID